MKARVPSIVRIIVTIVIYFGNMSFLKIRDRVMIYNRNLFLLIN